MTAQRIVVANTGLVSSVGLTTAATCAALRAGISNPSQTRCLGADGEWIMAHQVTLSEPWRARTKLVKMAALATRECLDGTDPASCSRMPVLLCVAEPERPGRLDGLDQSLLADLQTELGLSFDIKRSAIVAAGRPAALLALARARTLIHQHGATQVLIVAVDSLLSGSTLSAYDEQDRLLSGKNSNGFMPGEGAAAVLVSRPSTAAGELHCLGLGTGTEDAHLLSDKPLRADGMSAAIRQALAEAGSQIHELDFRITDISGEQYFFKEAALALSRTMRTLREEFDIWHPAECIGETGAVVGAAMIATALMAQRKGYAKGPRVLLHAAADTEWRSVAIFGVAGSR